MKIGPKYKIARRLGDPVFGKTQSGKFAVSLQRKQKKPSRRGKSEYGTQLIEKQKARFTYGLTAKMLANYVHKAQERKDVDPTHTLFTLFESRLDNVVYRLGFATSRAFARQLVSHGHIMVNGKAITVPSHQVKAGDEISIRPQSRPKTPFVTLSERLANYNTPTWLTLDVAKYQGIVKELPSVASQEGSINFNEIIGFYSRV